MFSLIPKILFDIMALLIGINLGIFIGEKIDSDSSTPDPIKNDPRCRIADDLFDQEHGATGNVPLHLRDAHYPGAKALGHGEDYLYPHDSPVGWLPQNY